MNEKTGVCCLPTAKGEKPCISFTPKAPKENSDYSQPKIHFSYHGKGDPQKLEYQRCYLAKLQTNQKKLSQAKV